MKSLYNKSNIICKLKKVFLKIFSNETKPTKEHLIELLLSVLELKGFQSVRYNFEHSIKKFSDFQLKSYYNTLKDGKLYLKEWLLSMVEIAISLIPKVLETQEIILSVDDTIIAKQGNCFEDCSILFDHTKPKGSPYTKGHCFVTLMLAIPIKIQKETQYISFPLGYRMWTQKETRIKMASDLVKLAMQVIGPERHVTVCCDSWYPKAEMVKLPDGYKNLNLICSVRSDTALYELPARHNGTKGRPQCRGTKISLKDFIFQKVPQTGMSVATKIVMTKLFGKRPVFALVTKSKSGSMRLFLSTVAPEKLHFDPNCKGIEKALSYYKKDKSYLPLTLYAFRWHIETAYYEQKKFWSLKAYMLRSKRGIESLINLLTIVYSMMPLLPLLNSEFSFLSNVSHQEARFLLSQEIQQEIFKYTLK